MGLERKVVINSLGTLCGLPRGIPDLEFWGRPRNHFLGFGSGLPWVGNGFKPERKPFSPFNSLGGMGREFSNFQAERSFSGI